MKNSRHLDESLLRSLIREYDIRLDLPYTTGIQTSELAGVGSLAVKAGLSFLLAVFAAKGYIWLAEKQSAFMAFADNIARIPELITKLSDTLDIVTSVFESKSPRGRLFKEANDKFKTRHGVIETDAIDKVLIKNLKVAASKMYIVEVTPKLTSGADLKSSMAQMVADVRSKITALVTAIKAGERFPENFASFSTSFTDVDPLGDLDAREKVIANKAMSDAVGTAVFNSIKDQTYEVFGEVVLDLEEMKRSSTKSDLVKELTTALTEIGTQIGDAIENTVPDDIKKVIAKDD